MVYWLMNIYLINTLIFIGDKRNDFTYHMEYKTLDTGNQTSRYQ